MLEDYGIFNKSVLIGGSSAFSVPSFSPSNLTNLALWLDASDTSTITIETGVSEWTDKSTKGNNPGQAQSTKQPDYDSINKSVDFDGIDDYLSSGDIGLTVGDFSIFIVGTFNPALDARLICEADTTGGGLIYSPIQSGNTDSTFMTALIRDDNFQSKKNQSNDIFAFNNSKRIIGVIKTSMNLKYYSNENTANVAIASSGTFTPNNFSIGALLRASATNYFNCKLNEIIITLDETQNVEDILNYLNTKWGAY